MADGEIGDRPSEEELLVQAAARLVARGGQTHHDATRAIARSRAIAERRHRIRLGATVVVVAMIAAAIVVPLTTAAHYGGSQLRPGAVGPLSSVATTPGSSFVTPGSTVPPAGAQAAYTCPSPLPTPPQWTGHRFCGRTPGAGDGDGPTGLCTGTETSPPCGPGAVTGKYYPFTLPTTCTGKVWFDGREWVSELPPGRGASTEDVWIALQGPTSAGWAGPGAVGLQPYKGQALSCGPPVPVKTHVTPQVLATHHTPSVPSYCDITTVTTTGTLTKAINIAIYACIAANTPTTQEIWPASGTELTPTQVVAQFMARSGLGDQTPTAAYVFKTTYGGAAKYYETGSNPKITPKAPAYLVTTHWPTGRVSTSLVSAITGKGTSGCSGCNIVQPDGKAIATPSIH